MVTATSADSPAAVLGQAEAVHTAAFPRPTVHQVRVTVHRLAAAAVVDILGQAEVVVVARSPRPTVHQVAAAAAVVILGNPAAAMVLTAVAVRSPRPTDHQVPAMAHHRAVVATPGPAAGASLMVHLAQATVCHRAAAVESLGPVAVVRVDLLMESLRLMAFHPVVVEAVMARLTEFLRLMAFLPVVEAD